MAENYSDLYKEMVFYKWHGDGKSISQRFCNTLPDEDGSRPTPKTIEKWRDNFGWIERAEALDVELSNTLKNEYVEKRNAMFEKHVDMASLLIDKAKDFLTKATFLEASDALRAVALGIEIERASIGQVEMGKKILEMTPDQLNKELFRLVGKDVAPDTDIVEGDTEDVS